MTLVTCGRGCQRLKRSRPPQYPVDEAHRSASLDPGTRRRGRPQQLCLSPPSIRASYGPRIRSIKERERSIGGLPALELLTSRNHR